MSRYFCFGECGCKYETMTKEQILAALDEFKNASKESDKPVVLTKSARVISAADKAIIQIENELFNTHCFIEIYDNYANLRNDVEINSISCSGGYLYIPFKHNSFLGGVYDLTIKITPLNNDYPSETVVYLHS